MTNNKLIDLAIIGGGVAGLTAGLYGTRAGLETILFEEIYPGGQTAAIEKLENYPGFIDGIEGMTLTSNIYKQATNSGLETMYNKIIEIKKINNELQLILDNNSIVNTKSIIIATGANPKKLHLPLEEKLTGRGVHYCATCDGAFYKDKIVMINGGGNTALTDSLILSNFAKKVYLVHRREEFRGDEILVNKVKNNNKIEIIYNNTIKELIGDDKLSSVILVNKNNNELQTITVDGLFVAIGVSPNSALAKGILKLSDKNEIITDRNLQTSIKGVFAAGDVRDTNLRQVITAAADGAIATSMASHYIKTL